MLENGTQFSGLAGPEGSEKQIPLKGLKDSLAWGYRKGAATFLEGSYEV